MRKYAGYFYGVLFLVSVVLIVFAVFNPKLSGRVTAFGNLLLVAATIIYVWINHALLGQQAQALAAVQEANSISRQTIEEMRQDRRLAATPVIRAETVGAGGNADGWFFRLKNVGNSLGLNVVVTIAGAPHEGGTQANPVIASRALVAPGDEFQAEARLLAYAMNPAYRTYEVIVSCENILGETIETTTPFPKRVGDALPGEPANTQIRRTGP